MRTVWVLLSLFCVGLLAFGSAAQAAPLGTTFTYQGRLTDTGDAATGPYDFIVRVYNAATVGTLLGTQYLNDVAVSDGYFTIQLNYGNVFNGDALWLDFQIRPGDGSAPYQLLSPRQPMNPTPYAMYAKNAGYATTAGAVTGGSLNGTGAANYLAKFMDADTLGNSVVFQDGDNIGINTTAADNHRLNVRSYNSNRAAVRGTDQSGDSIYAEGMLGMLYPTNLPYNPSNIGVLGIKPNLGAGGVAVYGWNNDDNSSNYAMYAVSDGAGTNNYGLYTKADGEGTTNYGIYASADNAATNYAGFFTSGHASSSTHVVHAETTFTTSADAIAVYGESTPTDNFGIGGKFVGGYRGVEGRVSSEGTGTYTGLYGYVSGGTGVNRGVYSSAMGGGTNYGIYATASGGTNNYAGYFSGNVYVSQNLGVRTIAPVAPLEVVSDENYAGYFSSDNASSSTHVVHAEMTGTTSADAIAVYGESVPTDFYGIGGKFVGGYRGVIGQVNPTGSSSYYGVYGLVSGGSGTNYGVYGYAYGTGTNNYGVYGYAGGGTNNYAGYFNGDVRVNGNLSIYDGGTKVIELGTGLDYAEGFDVSDAPRIQAGCVLSIDPENPGKLALSGRAYDRKVAGIVAGANQLGSGVRLGAGQFDHDVALAGRVYCRVDARREAIEPGDLLTTSDLPGYAMKVTDFQQAQGAILGKAMQSLEQGQCGQILVLVTLQ